MSIDSTRHVVASFNTGPADLGPGVSEAAAEIAASGLLALSHRGDTVKETVARAISETRRALGVPESYAIVTQPSATASMELTLRNLVRTRSAHFVGGAFGKRFADSAAAIGLEAHRLEHPWSAPPELHTEIPRGVELLTVTHNETSTGMLWPAGALAALRSRLDTEHPDALLAVDATSSLGGVEIDFEVADLWFASVQKALGLPAGLALVIAGPRALARAGELGATRGVAPWQDLPSMAGKMESGQTVDTPNVLGLALLGRSMEASSIAAAAERCRDLSALVRSAVDAGRLRASYFVQDPAWCSVTVHNLEVDDPAAALGRARRAGFVVGAGYGELKDRCLRIATFPAHRRDHLEALLDVLAD